MSDIQSDPSHGKDFILALGYETMKASTR